MYKDSKTDMIMNEKRWLWCFNPRRWIHLAGCPVSNSPYVQILLWPVLIIQLKINLIFNTVQECLVDFKWKLDPMVKLFFLGKKLAQ